MDSTAFIIAREVSNDSRLSMAEKALLLSVLVSDKPFLFDHVKLKHKLQTNNRAMSMMLDRLESLGYVSKIFTSGIASGLTAYRVNVGRHPAIENAVKPSKVQRAFEPKRFSIVKDVEVEFDDYQPDTEEEEIIAPKVINGVKNED